MRRISRCSFSDASRFIIAYIHVRHKATFSSKFLASGECVEDEMFQGRNCISCRGDVDDLLPLFHGSILWRGFKQILKDVGDAEDCIGALEQQFVSI